jgi:hypothetical protein
MIRRPHLTPAERSRLARTAEPARRASYPRGNYALALLMLAAIAAATHCYGG